MSEFFLGPSRCHFVNLAYVSCTCCMSIHACPGNNADSRLLAKVNFCLYNLWATNSWCHKRRASKQAERCAHAWKAVRFRFDLWILCIHFCSSRHIGLPFPLPLEWPRHHDPSQTGRQAFGPYKALGSPEGLLRLLETKGT